jgi:hypothetical protein
MILTAQRTRLAAASLSASRTLYTQSVNGSLWRRDLIVDPRGRLTAADIAAVWYQGAKTNAITTTTAREFLGNCALVNTDHCLHHDGELQTVFDEYYPNMEPLFASINTMASYTTGGRDAMPVAGGFHVRLHRTESQILRMCAVLPSIMLTNVMGVYFAPRMYAIGNAKKDRYEFTPVQYLWWALRRRFHMHTTGAALLRRPYAVAHVLETMSDMDKVLNAMQMNNLAVVMCVDRLPTTGLTCSDETESELLSLRQSPHALVISK